MNPFVSSLGYQVRYVRNMNLGYVPFQVPVGGMVLGVRHPSVSHLLTFLPKAPRGASQTRHD